MSLIDKIIIKWIPITSSLIFLEKEEWINMIKLFINRLNDKEITIIIKNKLEYFLSINYKIIISNLDPNNTIIYPKCKYLNNSVLIIIPNVPYFISTELIDSKLFDHYPKKNYPNLEEYKKYIFKEKVPGFISFVHELIHCLRFFEKLINDFKNEEANVIYGIEYEVLSYSINNKIYYITENQIRLSYGLCPRISHDAEELLCEGVKHTIKNNELFSKNDFFI